MQDLGAQRTVRVRELPPRYRPARAGVRVHSKGLSTCSVRTMITRSSLAGKNNGISQTGVTLFYAINPFRPSAGRVSRDPRTRKIPYLITGQNSKGICTVIPDWVAVGGVIGYTPSAIQQYRLPTCHRLFIITFFDHFIQTCLQDLNWYAWHGGGMMMKLR